MKAEIKKFMGATGSLKEVGGKEQLLSKLSKRKEFAEEEFNEFYDAVASGDMVEILDAVPDRLYFLIQDIIDLENAGFDVEEAINRIHVNNSLKYTTSFTLAGRWLKELREKTGKDDWYVGANEYEGEVYFCLKNKWTGKVAKYHDFPKVELGDLVPEEFK